MVQAPLSWAQDSNKLFLEVKLANKFDAAGCPNPTDVQIKIEPTMLKFSSKCLQAENKVKYVLDLPLWNNVSVSQSTYKYEPDGKY